MRRNLPAGTVTFLFTDVEGSTKLLYELGAEVYAEKLAEHRRVVREACTARGGVEVDTQGDAFFVAFPSAPQAVEAAWAITRSSNRGRSGCGLACPTIRRGLRMSDRRYSTARWQRLRRAVLAHYGYVCQLEGPRCTGYATTVHHLVPSSQAPQLFWEPANLVASCPR
jgi:class 3 adenylate cyclase